MRTICYTVVEVKDADDSYGLFENVNSAIEFAAEQLNADVNNIKLVSQAYSECMRVTINGEPQSLWIEFRDVWC